jgi:hypothetical protein
MIAHVHEHPADVKIVFQFSETERWSCIALANGVQRLICIELTEAHYTVTVLDLVAEETCHWNGFVNESASQEETLLNRQHQVTLDNLLSQTGLHWQSEVWQMAKAALYI